jgi:hypothetical protein
LLQAVVKLFPFDFRERRFELHAKESADDVLVYLFNVAAVLEDKVGNVSNNPFPVRAVAIAN